MVMRGSGFDSHFAGRHTMRLRFLFPKVYMTRREAGHARNYIQNWLQRRLDWEFEEMEEYRILLTVGIML